MSDIAKEIEQTAETMEKSTKTPKEILFDTIRQLGAEGIKAKLPSLEKSERELLAQALTEMKKAVAMDAEYQAKFVQGNIKDTKIQEDKADDDQDEKLVKPEAATIAHQGTPTDGWEGQVIKAIEETETMFKSMFPDQDKAPIVNMPENKDSVMNQISWKVDELKRLKECSWLVEQEAPEAKSILEKKFNKIKSEIKALVEKHGSLAKAKDMFKEQAKEKLTEKEQEERAIKDAEKKENKGKKTMEKAEKVEKKQGVPAGVDPAKHERCVRKVKGDKGKNPYAICNASMKKSEPMTPEVKEALTEIRKSVEEQLKEFGVEATPALIKAEMKRLLQEEDQDGDAPAMDVKTRANKEKVDALNLGADNKDAQKKVNDEKQGQAGSMKKAVWSGENDLLKAMTGGRNHHFSLEEYIGEVLKDAAKPTEEPIQKSESKKDDLNDIIAKGQDSSWDEINCDRMVKANKDKIRGKVVKSFEDNEIAQALGLSPEEAKKILGE